MISAARGRVSRRVPIPVLPTATRAPAQTIHTDILLSESRDAKGDTLCDSIDVGCTDDRASFHGRTPGGGRWVMTGRGVRELPGH